MTELVFEDRTDKKFSLSKIDDKIVNIKVADVVVNTLGVGKGFEARYLNRGVYLVDANASQSKQASDTIELPQNNSSEEFFPCFQYVKGQNHRILVVGASGSGKSTVIGRVLDQMASDTKKDIFIISFVNSDPELDRRRNGRMPTRIKLDYQPGSPEYTQIFGYNYEFFNNSIVVFDDVEKSTDKKLLAHILALRAQLFEMGRHGKTDLISVSHDILGGNVNKLVKAESTGCFLFPAHNKPHQTGQYLEKYVGLSEEQIHDVMTVKSRWVYIQDKGTQKYYVSSHIVKLLPRIYKGKVMGSGKKGCSICPNCKHKF